MIDNKREDNFDIESKIIFSHNYVLKFLEHHKDYVHEDQIIKIFIMAKRFRLSLQFIEMTRIPFEIEFFTNAIDSNAYDIAFYLLKVYEEQIIAKSQIAINTHVKSY